MYQAQGLELGADPDAPGSAWKAALSSFLSFAVGASLPCFPGLWRPGQPDAGNVRPVGLVTIPSRWTGKSAPQDQQAHRGGQSNDWTAFRWDWVSRIRACRHESGRSPVEDNRVGPGCQPARAVEPCG
jgi:hypothetical protein